MPPKPTARIDFSKEERTAIVERIQQYFHDELDQQIGAIPAELLLGFLEEEIGAFYYNRGLRDAQAALARKVEDFDEEIYGLERREARVR